MPVFNIKEFKPLADDTFGEYSHKVVKGTFMGKTWYCKEIKTAEDARKEALAQEFFRLIIPHQPETLIAREETTNRYFVLSEEVPGYGYLPQGKANNFSNGQFIGLGQVVTTAMFLQEIDLKNGNVGLDKQKRVIKIDGDWCFAERDYTGKYELTAEGIASLPWPKGYTTFNWLDLTVEGMEQISSAIVNYNLTDSQQFRSEVNQALFKICLIPDDFIKAFVDAYIPEGGDYYFNFIKERRNALTQAALKNNSFNIYLSGSQAEKDSADLLAQLSSFKAGNSEIIKPNQQTKLLSDFENRKKDIFISCNNLLRGLVDENTYLINFISYLNPSLATQLDDFKKENVITSVNTNKLEKLNKRLTRLEAMVKKNMELLQELRRLCDPEDQILNRFILNCHNKMNSIDCNVLQKVGLELQSVIQNLKSDEFIAVKDSVASFRSQHGFFSLNLNEKADKISQALYNIPLKERANVISSEQVNEVQKALAYHRHFWRVSAENLDGSINQEEAAQTYKDLKRKFPTELSGQKEIEMDDGFEDYLQTLI